MTLNVRLINKQNDPNDQIYLKVVIYFLRKLLDGVDCGHVKRVDIKTDAIMKDSGECLSRCLQNNELTVRIRLRKGMHFIEAVKTLAHECVHASQYISRKLRVSKTGNWYWGTRNFGPTPYKDYPPNKIEKLPWEKEAYYLENDLVMEYIDYFLESYS